MSPADVALMGGRQSDRLAFVFLAGYQAAIRSLFGVAGNQWSAFAVSEDRSGKLPGLHLDEQERIYGHKTWVAACDHLDEIIVSVNADLYRIPRTTSGLTIERKSDVNFLAEMSQGIASFEGVASDDIERLPPTDLKQFARSEPIYIYLALCANLKHQGHSLADDLIADLLMVASGDFTLDEHKSRLADVDLQLQSLFGEEKHPSFGGNFTQDKGLISLYSPVIQKRAGRG